MQNHIWLMYTEYLAQGNSERRDTGVEEFFRPDICIFTNKESLYQALKINLTYKKEIIYYKNQTEIFDFIIENGGYVQTPGIEEIRIETRKINQYSNIHLFWGLKSRKEIFDILNEIGIEFTSNEFKNNEIEENKWYKEIYQPWLNKNRKNEDKAEKENIKKLREMSENKKKNEEKKKKDKEKKKKLIDDDDDDE
jgi:hypothetical protein